MTGNSLSEKRSAVPPNGDSSRPLATMFSPNGAAYRGKAGCTWPLCSRDGNPDRCYGWHCLLCDEPTDAQGGHTCKEALDA